MADGAGPTVVAKEAAYLSILAKQEAPNWSNLKNAIGELIASDQSLRGDLAHVLHYLQCDVQNGRKALALSKISERVSDFADVLCSASKLRWGTTVDAPLDGQKVRQFINRKNETHKNPDVYGIYVLMLVGIALVDRDAFWSHYVLNEVGQLRDLLRKLADSTSTGGRVSDLTSIVMDFARNRDDRRQTKLDLGGLVELGNLGSSNLWWTLFGVGPRKPEVYRQDPSIERHFVCYRPSSLASPKLLLAKSFLILQSPGRTREHFAFKLFFKSRGSKVRKSSGAVVQMSGNLACLGSSRNLPMERNETSAELDAESDVIPGPKSLVFKASDFRNSALIMGITLTINEKEEPITTRICCVETALTHSDKVGIGVFKAEQLRGDLAKFMISTGAEAEKPNEATLSSMWDHLMSKLEEPANRGVVRIAHVKDIHEL